MSPIFVIVSKHLWVTMSDVRVHSSFGKSKYDIEVIVKEVVTCVLELYGAVK